MTLLNKSNHGDPGSGHRLMRPRVSNIIATSVGGTWFVPSLKAAALSGADRASRESTWCRTGLAKT
jgi:hypothetical protein